jgi:hypothetical protein
MRVDFLSIFENRNPTHAFAIGLDKPKQTIQFFSLRWIQFLTDRH